MALDLSADEELVTMELDLDDNSMFIINLIKELLADQNQDLKYLQLQLLVIQFS